MKKIPKETQLQTANSLIEDFQKIGIKPGMTLMVHSSLGAIGQARSTLFEMKKLVSFGKNYFENFL